MGFRKLKILGINAKGFNKMDTLSYGSQFKNRGNTQIVVFIPFTTSAYP